MKSQTMFADRKHPLPLAAAALVALALFTLPVFGQGAKKTSASRAIKQYTIEQFLTTTAIGGSSFSPDEKSILFSSNKSGIYNVYSVPVTGGESKQLTRSTTESTFGIGGGAFALARLITDYFKRGTKLSFAIFIKHRP